MVDTETFRYRQTFGIIPAGHYPGVHPAEYVAGERIAYYHYFRKIVGAYGFEHFFKKSGVRLFNAELLREEYTIHGFAYLRSGQLLRLRGYRTV